MDDKIITSQEAAQAAERAEATEECIFIPQTESTYYEAEKGCSNR